KSYLGGHGRDPAELWWTVVAGCCDAGSKGKSRRLCDQVTRSVSRPRAPGPARGPAAGAVRDEGGLGPGDRVRAATTGRSIASPVPPRRYARRRARLTEGRAPGT